MTPGEPEPFRGWVGIDGRRIALVTRDRGEADAFRAAHPGLRCIDAAGKLLMPGLIDTHCHAGMTLQRCYADDLSLMSWLNDYIWPFEARQSAGDVMLGTELGVAELLLGGVTSFVDMYWHEDRNVEVVRRMGIRAMLGVSYFDTNVEEAMRTLPAAMEAARGCDRIRIAAAPHAPYTVSPENYVRGKRFCDEHGLHFMTHAAETAEETRIVRERYGKSPVAHLDALGVLDDRTIAAHCVHVSDEDIATLVRRGVAVSHNPQSNMKLASGTAPVERMRREGALVTIATDGPCSNNDLDMWEEMRTAALLQKSATGDPCAMPAEEVLRMVTVNGARALGWGDELGVIREGALADVILIDLQKPHFQPVHRLAADLVYCGKAADVETVVVDGEIVVENRRVLHTDLARLFRDAEAAVRRITSCRG